MRKANIVKLVVLFLHTPSQSYCVLCYAITRLADIETLLKSEGSSTLQTDMTPHFNELIFYQFIFFNINHMFCFYLIFKFSIQKFQLRISQPLQIRDKGRLIEIMFRENILLFISVFISFWLFLCS